MPLNGDRRMSLMHLQRLTDCFGVIQHASYAVPDYRSGYTTDDNARALVVACKHRRLHGDALSAELATRYLAFLMFAQREDGRFHNLIGYDRRPLDEVGSEDCFGRALHALAYVLYAPPLPGLVGPAERMLHQALPHVPKLEHPRGKAMTLTALYFWGLARPEEAQTARTLATSLAEDLVRCYREHSRPDWDWLLPEMTYANAKLPEALFRAYQLTDNAEFLQVGRRTLAFLCRRTLDNGTLRLVGNHGWHRAGDDSPPAYDQQPIDAASMVEALLAAFESTGEIEYLRKASCCYEWFHGRNSNGRSLYDPETGGCFDALTENGVNLNRGAESVISMLLAHLSLLEAKQRLSQDVLNRAEPECSAARVTGQGGGLEHDRSADLIAADRAGR